MSENVVFPSDPYEPLDPSIRWPAGAKSSGKVSELKSPPMVPMIRTRVKEWREAGYPGASETTKALLMFWFHDRPWGSDWRYYFAQQEAVESAIWMYEIEKARDKRKLQEYAPYGVLETKHFMEAEEWARYVVKMATGSGKTKVMSLLIVWSYYHKLYEPNSPMSKNFMVIAPNRIVLDRLLEDFGGGTVFNEPHTLPTDGFGEEEYGPFRAWESDWQITVHEHDHVGTLHHDTGHLFVTNVQQIYDRSKVSPDFAERFLGVLKADGDSGSQLTMRDVASRLDSLMVLNDEAHHIHDEGMSWFQSIVTMHQELERQGAKLCLQMDFTATPRGMKREVFPNTICEYTLIEAIRQRIVKTPIVPNDASRGELEEQKSEQYVARYKDYIDLGVTEWRKAREKFRGNSRQPVLFVMVDKTSNADEVGEYLRTLPGFEDPESVLVIHTKRDGEVKDDDLDELRKKSREIDDAGSKTKAIVSVLMLREGWDVKSVTTIVGLRAYTANNQILPEQTLGRGLRLMLPRGDDVREYVSVIGTDEFANWIAELKEAEGLELTPVDMGADAPAHVPTTVRVDDENPEKEIDKLDIAWPQLRERNRFEAARVLNLRPEDVPSLQASMTEVGPPNERQIVFVDVDEGTEVHSTALGEFKPRNLFGLAKWFGRQIARRTGVGAYEAHLSEQIHSYLVTRVFAEPLRYKPFENEREFLVNLNQPAVVRGIVDAYSEAIRMVVNVDNPKTEIVGWNRISQVRLYESSGEVAFPLELSIFNEYRGRPNSLEESMARFLDRQKAHIISHAKNPERKPGAFSVDYLDTKKKRQNYYPDFLVKQTEGQVWIIETKGRVDLDSVLKWRALVGWCKRASQAEPLKSFTPLWVEEKRWGETAPKDFEVFIQLFKNEEPDDIGPNPHA